MSGELDVNWETVTWRQLIEAIRNQKAESSFAAPAGSADSGDPRDDPMMDLTACRDCGKPIKITANQCPYCFHFQ